MMNEWKELEIDKLPPDILTGNYEFDDSGIQFLGSHKGHMEALFENMIHGYSKPRYRKLKPSGGK